MPKAERNEVSYYPEIMNFIKEQIESNITASGRRLKVYCKTGELRKGLEEIIHENDITSPAIIKFAQSTPPLSLDIFGLITDGEKYQLLIMEIKLLSSVGLTQLSQLIGYCIVSNAQYGLLINVNGGESPRLTNLLMNDSDLTYIVRDLVSGNRRVEHKLGVMEWDSESQNIRYTGIGKVRTISELFSFLDNEFD